MISFYICCKGIILLCSLSAQQNNFLLILNLERTLFIRHQNGCLTKNCY